MSTLAAATQAGDTALNRLHEGSTDINCSKLACARAAEQASGRAVAADMAETQKKAQWPKIFPVRINRTGYYARLVLDPDDEEDGYLLVRHIDKEGNDMRGHEPFIVRQHLVTKVDRHGDALPAEVQFKEIMMPPTPQTEQPPVAEPRAPPANCATPGATPPVPREEEWSVSPRVDLSGAYEQPTPPARGTAAEMRRAAAVEAALEAMERDPAKVASAVVDEFGQLFGGVDVAALLRESAAAGEDVHAVAMKLVRDAINIEARRRSSEEGVGAERAKKQLDSMTCATPSDDTNASPRQPAQ